MSERERERERERVRVSEREYGSVTLVRTELAQYIVLDSFSHYTCNADPLFACYFIGE